MNRIYLFTLIFVALNFSNAQTLSIEKIMQDPEWMGNFPSNVEWSLDSKRVFFNYNPENNPSDSVYTIEIKKPELIQKADKFQKRLIAEDFISEHEISSQYLSIENGNLFLYQPKYNKPKLLLDLNENINHAEFLNELQIGLIIENNAFVLNLNDFQLKQLTDIQKGKRPNTNEEKESWLEKENVNLIDVLARGKVKDSLRRAYRRSQSEQQFTFYTEDQYVYGFRISPSLNAVTFNLSERSDTEYTKAADFVDKSGYTKMVNARPKVGKESSQSDLVIYNILKDTAFVADASALPGIKTPPEYLEEYGQMADEEPRPVNFYSPEFSPNGKKAVVVVRSHDNKDRWICEVSLEDGSLRSLDHQRDEAWIGGPGIGSYGGSGTMGWIDNNSIYFQSEETGFSHLYSFNIKTSVKKALTRGKFEVFQPRLSKDKKYWYLSASQGDLRQRHFFKMPVNGGEMIKLTKGIGKHDVVLSPDEKYLAVLFSKANQPEELYIKRNKVNAEYEQITFSTSEEFKAYDWKTPEFIDFKASDGVEVPARLYKPETANFNGAAVIFVHGAGYLQNAHKWWSSYFREYMFHNLLTDLGYTVLDIDYRGSAGYGRDWRTAIYRHMGGKDLSDQVDGVNYLIENHNIDPDRIGIYGGSYGGFITLMGMFNEADIFKAGAALRSVTDWAHYNHGYTSNILNTPEKDPIAYRRSSPIYFAEGLQGHLLMCHGVMDTNVQFQDIVRLTQRLIELEKDNWELAIYPVEGHGFTEPESWTDEYKRILKLFEETIGK
jgi:dipeptidyl aminopeptidase/acylaminoacyl peptidase